MILLYALAWMAVLFGPVFVLFLIMGLIVLFTENMGVDYEMDS